MANATGSGADLVNVMERNVPAVATAGNDATTVLGRVQRAGTVSAVTYTPAADVTGAATNNRTLTLVNKGQDGNGNTTVATLSFGNGTNASDFDDKALSLSGTAANLDVAAGDVLAWVSAHVGTGITDPGGVVTVTFSSRAVGHSASGYIRGV